MKFIISILILCSSSLKMTAQDTAQIFINGIKAAESVIAEGQTNALLILKKPQPKKLTTFIVKVTGNIINNQVYKRSIEIESDGTVIIEEIKNKPGYFDILKTKTFSLLSKRKPVALYILLNPSNPLMSVPSRRVFLGNLVMK